MTDTTTIALLTPVAYLLGTFPTASLMAQASGVDIRTVGSGNPGASNVMRVLGWKRGAWVFAIDAVKGVIAAAVGLALGDRVGGYVLAAAAIIGHIFPLWNRFRGGKGVATGAGAFLVLAPVVSGVLMVVWLVVSKLSHTASLASIAVIALLPIGVGIARRSWWEFAATLGMCALVMLRHRDNIGRLRSREEHALR